MFKNCIKYAEKPFSQTRILPYRIYDSVLIRKNTSQKKPIFSHIFKVVVQRYIKKPVKDLFWYALISTINNVFELRDLSDSSLYNWYMLQGLDVTCRLRFLWENYQVCFLVNKVQEKIIYLFYLFELYFMLATYYNKLVGIMYK